MEAEVPGILAVRVPELSVLGFQVLSEITSYTLSNIAGGPYVTHYLVLAM